MGLDHLEKHQDYILSAKKALLALLMFSFTDLFVERFDCHHTPRNFAELVVQMSTSFICTDSVLHLGGLQG